MSTVTTMENQESAKTARYKRKLNIYNEMLGTAFIAPYFIFFIIFSIVPIFYGLWVSFHKWTLVGKDHFVGLENYIYALKDIDFWLSLWHTTLFVMISTPVLVTIPFVLALVIDQKMRGRTLLRTVFFTPNILSVSVVSSVWIFVLQPYSGLLNTLLHKIGIQQELFWLSEPGLAWISIVMITLWWTEGFNMMIYLAGLQDIPTEHYEAATIDGAGAWQKLRYITLPAMRGVFVLLTVLQVIANFKIFGQVWLVTHGGPGNQTRTMIQYIYETGFSANELGRATAMSFIFFVLLITLSFLQFKFFSGKKD
ncbi:carbohydrate ABC transporter permease [Paenibacillus aestuarii]|uniref:Sugar ABC transporter permease n=1 Tax=Paenibacillus aestuarii TaxID=516965 RepID=A0ABW0KG75_9BACL|nr:sugar ABC transporter permease [Paenibacillus aestuarii]